MNKLTYVLSALCKDYEPGKKMVQKLVYLVERKGLDLDMDYSIHFYGPYSSDLDQYMHALEANNVLTIDTSGLTHKLRFLKKPRTNPLSETENGILNDVISLFANKSALELEVLTTTDYVTNNMLSEDDRSKSAIIKLVKKIKGSKFSDNQIENCIQVLSKNGLINIGR